MICMQGVTAGITGIVEKVRSVLGPEKGDVFPLCSANPSLVVLGSCAQCD